MIKTIIIFLTSQIIFGQCVKGDCYDKNGKYIFKDKSWFNGKWDEGNYVNGEYFYAIMPIPPTSAKAIAILDSVTVSMAADIKGTLMFIFFVSFVCVDASLGKKSLYLGKRRTSSKVSAFCFTLSMLDYNKTIVKKK